MKEAYDDAVKIFEFKRGYWKAVDDILELFMSTDVEDLETIKEYKSLMYQTIIEMRPNEKHSIREDR